jgi:hypothetical protein
MGIWPKDVKKDHINCAHATSSTIVTGDDQGTVNLYKFPCPEPAVRIFELKIYHVNQKIISRRNIKHFLVIPIM